MAIALLAGCQQRENNESAPAPAAAVKGALIVPDTNAAPSGTSARAESAAAATKPDLPVKSAVDLTEKPGDPLTIGFDRLAAYSYELGDDLAKTNAPPAGADEKIPKEIRALNNRQVALKGFMLPLKVEGGLVTEMLIMRDQSMCCYGTVPKINEWVSAKMVKGGVKPVMDQPVTMIGKLRVGEMRENGYLVGIYALEADSMNAP
jgi:hypothetical protein